MKNSWKRMFCGVLTGSILLGLSGCGGNGTSGGEDLSKVPEDAYEINWYIQSKAQKDVASVEAAVNEYLKDKINATVKLNILESSQYEKKMGTMIASGESFDLAFTSEWLLKYETYAKDGAFFDMTDYLDTYLKNAASTMDKDYLESAYVEDRLYAMPVAKEIAQQKGWVYRKDIAEKYNLDMSQYKTFEDLEPVLKMIKEKEPGIEYPIDWTSDRAPFSLNDYTMVTTDTAIFADNGVARNKIENAIESEEFKKSAETARRFYNEGLVKPDVLTATDLTQRFQEGKTFVYMEYLKPGKAEETYRGKGIPVDQVGISPIYKTVATGSMMAISKYSKNPYRVMRFLDLLYSDPYLSNLFVYGIEGKHYTKIDEDMVDVPADTEYSLSDIQWMFGNVFLNYLTKTEAKDKKEQLKAFNEAALTSPFNGIRITVPVDLDVQNMALGTVNKQYRKQAVLGAMEPAAIIDEYVKELKAAGIDTIIEACQKQYDEILKEKE